MDEPSVTINQTVKSDGKLSRALDWNCFHRIQRKTSDCIIVASSFSQAHMSMTYDGPQIEQHSKLVLKSLKSTRKRQLCILPIRGPSSVLSRITAFSTPILSYC
jgi:hypothetical protein